MTLLNTINVGGTNYGITGAAIVGGCATPAGSEIKVCTFSDNFELKAGDMLLVKFTYANTYGDGSTTYPKLQVNSTNYVMRRADGNYLQSGEWGNNATLTFLFDGTDFILPAGSGAGNAGGIPLGTVLAIYTNQVPDGYLPCNGVQFDTAQFAALYALLGDDHTPDLREVTLRGIGHNGTYVFDSTETDPSTGQAGTQNHDEYTLGEFKDDQLQDHRHEIYSTKGSGGYSGYSYAEGTGGAVNNNNTLGILNAYRSGTVTRGKSVGVNYIIKATSGLPDSQQDYILNQLAPVDEVALNNVHSVTSNAVAESLSYSTTEQKTGGYWIDGKPVYKKTWTGTTSIDGWNLIASLSALNISKVIKAEQIYEEEAYIQGNYFASSANRYRFLIRKSDMALIIDAANNSNYVVTLEYTKTTD